jgi:hypothetical protein
VLWCRRALSPIQFRATDHALTAPLSIHRSLTTHHRSSTHHPFQQLIACSPSASISPSLTRYHPITRSSNCHVHVYAHHAFNTTYHSPSVTFSFAVRFNLAITHRHHGRLSVFVPITHSTTPLTTHRPLAITHRYPHRLISKPHAYVPDESVEMQSESHPCLGVADVFCLPFADVCFALCNNCGCRPTEAQSA